MTERLCACGCGQPTRLAPHTDATRGWVRGEPLTWVKGHHPRGVGGYLAYDVDEKGCWNYGACVTPKGYALVRVDGHATLAHRYFYELHVGPIPGGMQIDHLCFNRRCVNPAHLEPVTAQVNSRRAADRRPRITHCKHGHEFTDANTYISKQGYRYCRRCFADTQAIYRRRRKEVARAA